MTTERIIERMSPERIYLAALVEVKREKGRIFYVCPWCGPDCGHWATRKESFAFSPVHCFATGVHAHVVDPAVCVEAGLDALAKKIEDAPIEFEAGRLFRLWSEKGVPLELIQEERERISPRAFRLFEKKVVAHRRKSREANSFGNVYGQA